MLERMNGLIACQGKAADKVTAMIPNSNTGQASNTTNRMKKYAWTAESLFFTNRKLAMSLSPMQASIPKDGNQAKLTVWWSDRDWGRQIIAQA
jgi:hypothetical protein